MARAPLSYIETREPTARFHLWRTCIHRRDAEDAANAEKDIPWGRLLLPPRQQYGFSPRKDTEKHGQLHLHCSRVTPFDHAPGVTRDSSTPLILNGSERLTVGRQDRRVSSLWVGDDEYLHRVGAVPFDLSREST
jgi:hypothetical protein